VITEFIGLAAAFPLAHVMASTPMGSLQVDPAVVLGVAVALAFVGIFACWLPAWRAATLDAVKAIRYE
jgi:putative ABC transport system permease protein